MDFLAFGSKIKFTHNGFDFFEMTIPRNELQPDPYGDCGDDQIYSRNGSSSF